MTKAFPLFKKVQAMLDDLNTVMQENLMGVPTVGKPGHRRGPSIAVEAGPDPARNEAHRSGRGVGAF